MEDLGQIIPSISNISINFRTAENEMEILTSKPSKLSRSDFDETLRNDRVCQNNNMAERVRAISQGLGNF